MKPFEWRIVIYKVEKRPKIVLVDGSPVTQMLCERIFTELDMDFVGLKKGNEAIKLISEESMDLLILDIELPDIDGMKVASTIREKENGHGPLLPIILVSGHYHNYTSDDFRSVHIDDYLIKPIDYDNLVGIVKKRLSL